MIQFDIQDEFELKAKENNMGVGYTLVNYTKKEMVMFLHIPAQKARELAGNPISAAMTTWYLLQNLGDKISFVSDTYDDWPFPSGSKKDRDHYREVTEQLVDSLIKAGILKDEGILWADEDEPELVYMRADSFMLTNVNNSTH